MAVNFFQYIKVNSRGRNKLSPGGHSGLCYLCDTALRRADYMLCRECLLDLPFIRYSCPVCALPGITNSVCADCLNSRRLYIDRSISIFRYEYPVNQLVIDLKFHAKLPIAGLFARLLKALSAGSNLAMPDAFVPVPLHNSRLASRGFNQSRLICNHLSGLTGIPALNNLCHRVRATRSQSGLNATDRRRNLKGAFSISRNCRDLPGHIAIVDDVVTTGATTGEMARALSAAGIRRIDVWSCCRAD